MPRNPNTPCAVCGKMLWPTTKLRETSLGQICHPCRRVTIKHGTQHAYDVKGCRCDVCRKARTASVQNIPLKVREFVYSRDGLVCQLCHEPVDTSLPSQHSMSATLDHIECQSWVLIPNNRVENLRLAHRSCNSRRGARAA